MDPNALAKAFVEHYYSTFDGNRAGLTNLYQEGFMLTFEGQKIQGTQNIVVKLTSLTFQQCQHSIIPDCQPFSLNSDGKAQVAKDVVESISLVDLSITFKVTEGDLLETYNSFKFILKVSPNILEGSVAQWTLEYEKLSEDTADPNSLLEAVLQIYKDIDAYVVNLI